MYKCLYCDRKTKTIHGLKKHILLSHLQYELYCPYCKENFEYYEEFKGHLMSNYDMFHRNLYYLLIKDDMKKVNKELLIKDTKEFVKNK